MSEECKRDPSKHNGEQCPIHGGSGNKKLTKGQEISLKGKKYKINGFYKDQKLQDNDDFADEFNSDFRGIQLIDDKGRTFDINASQLDRYDAFDDNYEEEFKEPTKNQIKNIKKEALTYEGEDSPDIAWLQNNYNVEITHTDSNGYSVTGEPEDVKRFFNDHNLGDYGNSIEEDAFDDDYKSDFEEKHNRFNNNVGKFISGQGSDQELNEMISDLRKDYSDEEIIKKLAMMFKGTIK